MKKTMVGLMVMVLILFSAQGLMAKNPYLAGNNSWISLKGTVVTAGPSAFELDYGEGIVTVEMDDWDWYGEAYPLMSGDEVTVYGRVDDDLYEVTSIEASSVYVKNLNTYFYASAVDEEDYQLPMVTWVDVDVDLQYTGTVTAKDGREFTMDTGTRTIRVDTSEMLYNPLDDKGFQKINKGDVVQVTGNLDKDFFERKEIMAETITTLVEDKTKKK